MKTSKHSGIAVVEIILVLVFVGLLAGLGYVYFMNASSQNKDNTTQQSSSDSQQASSVEEVSTIESTDDLDTATKELDSLDLDENSDDSNLKNIESSL